MTEALIADFLSTFKEDDHFPQAFVNAYELIECLAHNEMGETLLVKDWQSGAYCVAKCYAREWVQPQHSESDLLKRLHHAGLPVYVAEYENDAMLVVVRAYTEGQPLDRLAQSAALQTEQAVDIAIQLCDILTYLHSQTPPVIHRDIKPQNVIVDEQGQVTLIDFGISRTYNGEAQEDTLCFGTRHYAAPEQYGFAQTDGRADIFSLGVLLCWMLTGREDVEAVIAEQPQHRLIRIIRKCTAFAPKERYQSAAQVKADLSGQTTRRQVLLGMGAGLLVLASAAAALRFGLPQLNVAGGVKFSNPLIEQAVRLHLGKTDGEELTPADLLLVSDLYIFGNQAAEDGEGYNAIGQRFMNKDPLVKRGEIESLADLGQLVNLRELNIAFAKISDVAPLAGLAALETIELKHNPLADIAPLAGNASLGSLQVFDTQIADFTALKTCPALKLIDAGYTQVRSLAAFTGLDVLEVLVLRRTPLQSLDQVENLTQLRQIYLSETSLKDLSPLLKLPLLEKVEVDEEMRTAAEAIQSAARFEITYQ
jgi:hypothetical protein